MESLGRGTLREQRFQPEREPGPADNGANRQQDTRHEGGTIKRVMSQREHLARVAEQDLFVSHEAAQTNGVDTHAVDTGAASAVKGIARGIRGRGRPGSESRLRYGASSVGRGARGRVELVGMMQFDDFDRLEIGRCLAGEPHEQHGTQSEVGRDHHTDARVRSQQVGHLGHPALRESGSAHHHVDPVLNAEAHIAHDRIGSGEVDGHLAAGSDQAVQGVAQIDRCGDGEIVGRVDGANDLAAHAARGAQHGHPEGIHPASVVGGFQHASERLSPEDRGMRPRSLAVTMLSSALGVVLLAAPPSQADEGQGVPMPGITPIAAGPVFTGALQNLKATGYTEREFVVTVTDPHVYSYTGSTTEVQVSPAPPSPEGAYRSRIIVRAPADPADFNGRVLVEMMNTTTTVDLDVAWEQAHAYLMRSGWAYVGITVQQTGINALERFRRDNERYRSLDLNLQVPAARADQVTGARDPSLAWDLTSQVGALLERGGAASPLDGYAVKNLILTGQSQMAGYATTYVNAIHPLHQVFDGFLVAYRGVRATNLQYAKPVKGTTPDTSKSLEQRRLAGGGTPVLNLQTESDPLFARSGTDAAVWREDADTADDRFRLWEVAGSSHNDLWGARQALTILERDYVLPFKPACDWKAPTGINGFPTRYAWNSALEALGRWIEEGVAPASVDRIQRAKGDVARDARGNAKGGLRLSPMDVPVATRGPESAGGLFCPLTGFQTPFPRPTLTKLYPTTADYVAAVTRASEADVAAGILLAEDAAELVRLAKRGPWREAQTIRTY